MQDMNGREYLAKLAKLPSARVVLCACRGHVANRVPLDEIGQFLHRMAPYVRVVVGDDLCQRHAIRRLSKEEGLPPLVIGACSQLRSKPYFWEEASNTPLNPYSTRIVDLLEETAAPYNDIKVAERVKLLLWAQIRRASEFREIYQHNLRLSVSTPHDKVTRREFLAIVLPRYEIIPFIELSKCIGGDRCRLCQDSCPLQAVLIEENEVAIDQSICSGCGACVTACPHGAVSYPTFSLEELDNEMEGLLLAEGVSLEPRMIALACQTCLPRYGGGKGNQLGYPPNMLPLKIPCLAMASPWLMLRAFDMGAQGLALISGERKCRNGLDAAVWQDNIRFVRAILGCWDIEAERIRLFETTEDNQLDVEGELGQFAREIAGLSPTPLKAVDYISAPTEGLRLPALIKGMGNKLGDSLEGTISTGTVPFGKVTLDGTKCTGCGLCTLNCPTDALTVLTSDDGVNYQLLFHQDSCVACGACVDTCPEDCLELEHILELDRIGKAASVLFHDNIAICRRCGKPIAPKAMMDGLKAKLEEAGANLIERLELCPMCRTEIQHYKPTGIERDAQIAAVNTNSAVYGQADQVIIE